MTPRPPPSTLFPYTTLFRSRSLPHVPGIDAAGTVVESTSDLFRSGDEVIVTGYELGAGQWGGWSELIRSEEHTSELQSQSNLVCRLLLEKKNNKTADGHIAS